jgi:replicative DNA helicase
MEGRMCAEKKDESQARVECLGNEDSPPINPVSLPAECSVLGALIEDDSFVPVVFALGLRCEDFFLSDHRRIWQAIEVLHARNAPVDFVSVAEQLGNRDEDYAAIADLMYGVVLHEDHIVHHARIVRKNARLRTLLRIGEWISKAVAETADPDLIAAQIRNMLDACLEGTIRV